MNKILIGLGLATITSLGGYLAYNYNKQEEEEVKDKPRKKQVNKDTDT